MADAVEIPPNDETTPLTEQQRETLLADIETTITDGNDDDQRTRDILSAIRGVVYFLKNP